MANADELGVNRQRSLLSPFDATCVVVGAIVGVGIFITPSQVAASTGSVALSLAAWGVGGVIALCGALTFAELGGRYCANGAQYTVLRDGYGAWVGFIFVVCNATAVQAGAMGIIALACVANLNIVVGQQDWPTEWKLALSIALIMALTLINIAGVQWGARVQNATVVAKLAALALIVALAAIAAPELKSTPAEPAAPSMPMALGFLAAIVPTIFAYGGWQHALWLAGEVRQPARTIPRAILGGVVIVIVTYLAVNWAYFRLLSLPEVATTQTLAADALSNVSGFGGWGRWLIALAVSVSAFGVLNAQLLSGPRLIQGMARDGRFFSIFAGNGTRKSTPAAAIVFLCALAVALLLAAGGDGLNLLTNGVVFVDGIFFAMTGLALIVIRQRHTEPTESPGFRTPGYPMVPLVFSAGMVGVVIGSFANSQVRGAALIGVGWIVGAVIMYAVMFRRASPRAE